MKTTMAALIGLIMSITVAFAQQKNQSAAEIAAVVQATAGKADFSVDQTGAMNAAVVKLNGGADLTESQKTTLRGILVMVRSHEAKAPAGKGKDDAKKFADALEKALEGSVIPASTASSAKRSSGKLSQPVKTVWEGEDPAAPKINAGHAEHLLFSAKIAGGEVATVGEDAALYKNAAENAAKFLKGETTSLSELDAVTLQECGSQIRLSGFGSEMKQKLNKNQLLSAINAALQKGGYELVQGTAPVPATPPAATPAAPTAPTAPATPPAPVNTAAPGAGTPPAPAATAPAAPATPPPAKPATVLRATGRSALDDLKARRAAAPVGAK